MCDTMYIVNNRIIESELLRAVLNAIVPLNLVAFNWGILQKQIGVGVPLHKNVSDCLLMCNMFYYAA